MFNPVIICLFKSRKELTYFGSSPQWSLQMLQLLQSALNTCRWRAVPVRCGAAVLQCPGHGGAHQCNLQFTMCTEVSAVLLQPLHFVTLCGFPRPPWNTKPSVQTCRRRLTLFGLENTKLWEGCFYGYDFLFAWIKQLCPLMSMIKTYDVKWWSNCIAF